MKYTFKDMLTAEIYESTLVMFIFGKHDIFNNLVSDELKALYTKENILTESVGIAEEFGLSTDDTDNSSINSVDFDTFMEVNGVANVNGMWFCKTELQTLNKKQIEKLNKYIKNPSTNGILVVVSNDWKVYKDFLRNKVLSFSKSCHIMELSFPSRDILKALVKQLFEEVDIDIQPSAIDMFITKMSAAYNDYEKVINDIKDSHGSGVLESKDLKVYMKGIENYVLDDFVDELTKTLSSDKTNNKKILRIMVILMDEIGAKNLVYQLLKIIDECIEFRVLINTGYIPITLNYFFNDVIKDLGPDSKYSKMKEWTFRKKASLAAKTSLRDWEYMKLILFNAIKDFKYSSESVIEARCQKALYEICTRTVITPDRINNIVGIDNVLTKERLNIDKIIFNEASLEKIILEKELAEKE